MEKQQEINEILKLSVGSEEAVTLKPAKVKIVEVKVEELGTKKSHKVVCVCKHPAKDETISLSSLKYENKGKLEVSGLWVNKDSIGMIRKGSALAVMLQRLNCANISELKGKEVETLLDDKGYLAFKGY